MLRATHLLQCVPYYAWACCKVLRVLCERGLRKIRIIQDAGTQCSVLMAIEAICSEQTGNEPVEVYVKRKHKTFTSFVKEVLSQEPPARLIYGTKIRWCHKCFCLHKSAA